eukprot:TRINITY_DN76663_c0_g1_i1.p1 TRINITY_DN76663_c0_g1~~TRINITY_DN76663_c0_g1_i1.p1  ORF type:complete len:681 (+),score=127.25 TRINITY_DN76663_c0_g1_i1:99-2045(+)
MPTDTSAEASTGQYGRGIDTAIIADANSSISSGHGCGSSARADGEGWSIAVGDSGPVLSIAVSASSLAELFVDLAPRRLRLRDGEAGRIIEVDLPFAVDPGACQVRFRARKRQLVVVLSRPLAPQAAECGFEHAPLLGADAVHAVELTQMPEAVPPASGQARGGAGAPAGSVQDFLREGGPRGGGPRPLPPVRVRDGVMPEKLARDVQKRLHQLPSEAWALATGKNQPLPAGSRAGRIQMSYRRLHDIEKFKGLEKMKRDVEEAVAAVLGPRPHERILLNFSKYEEGDFLDSHPDVPSGSIGYERREAFVWHLSDGWEDEDGGLFVDEEAEDGPWHLTPRFNTLASFPVPRWHAVTKVTLAKGRRGPRARFAAYGWVVVPRLERILQAPDLQPLLEGAAAHQGRSLAVCCIKEPLAAEAKSVLAAFAGLPLEKVGCRDLIELCTFAVTADPRTRLLLSVPSDAKVAVAVVADPADAKNCASYTGDAAPLAGFQVCIDTDLLRKPTKLRRFIDGARRIFSPCPELDLTDGAFLEDMWLVQDVKVFVFVARAERSVELLEYLNAWAQALQPRLRFFLAEPTTTVEIMADFDLTPADAPTVAALDSSGLLGNARLKDHVPGPGGRPLDFGLFRQWLGCVAEAAGLASPQLR